MLNNSEFLETWKIYNEYLLEDYGIILNDTQKQERLADIEKLANGDEKFANDILEIMIARGETTILMPDDNEFA